MPNHMSLGAWIAESMTKDHGNQIEVSTGGLLKGDFLGFGFHGGQWQNRVLEHCLGLVLRCINHLGMLHIL